MSRRAEPIDALTDAVAIIERVGPAEVETLPHRGRQRHQRAHAANAALLVTMPRAANVDGLRQGRPSARQRPRVLQPRPLLEAPVARIVALPRGTLLPGNGLDGERCTSHGLNAGPLCGEILVSGSVRPASEGQGPTGAGRLLLRGCGADLGGCRGRRRDARCPSHRGPGGK